MAIRKIELMHREYHGGDIIRLVKRSNAPEEPEQPLEGQESLFDETQS